MDEYAFKTRVITFGLETQTDISEDDSPVAFFINGGYEFRKLYEASNLYWSVGPHVKIGWMTGDWRLYTQEQTYDFSFNSFAWGASIVPSAGLILEDDYKLSIYLEGEFGILNYHTKAKIRPLERLSKKYDNNYLKLNWAMRAGLRGNVSSKLEAKVWAGLSGVNTDDALRHIRYNNRRLEKFPLFAQVGIGIGF